MEKLNLNNETKSKILSILNLLLETNINDYQIQSYNKNKNSNCIILCNKLTGEKIEINKEQLESNNNLSETFELKSEEKKMEDNDLLSVTSEVPEVNIQMGGMNKSIFKSLKYSETSEIKFNDKSEKYSETSILDLEQMGGNYEETDTLRSISEIKDRKIKKLNNSSKLDIDIFKRSQLGGSQNNINLKKKMLELGIKSNMSTTSSICE